MRIVEPVRLFDEFRQRRRDLLRTVGPGVAVTIVAFGIAFYAANRIEAIASLYFEPLWVFHRADLTVADLGDLKSHRIALGETGSGSHELAIRLLEANGVRDGNDGTSFLEQGALASAEALETGQIDVAMFVIGPDAPVVRRLLQDANIALMDFSRQRAYQRRFPYLKGVYLEQGVVDFENNLPQQRVRLVAPAANLVATTSLHEAFVPLLMEAALERHDNGGLLVGVGELPSLDYVSFPVNATARHYLTHGPSFFQRHLSFWVASLFDRTKIMIIPLVTLLIPLFKIAPPVYRWRIRSRIYRWYGVLRRIDQELRQREQMDSAGHAATLQAMAQELETVHVPLSYMEEFYNLRLHINMVHEELQRMKKEQKSPPATASDAGSQ